MKPLEGIRLIDLTHMLAGPHCTMMLTDLGAEAIMVEPPGRGAATRALYANTPDGNIDGVGANILTQSRGKKSVTIDLKSSAGLELFYELVQAADVVANNFSPGVTERLKIDYAALSRVNPRIITCSITGFGLTGPHRDRAAFDMVAQAYSGGMSITGDPQGEPMRAGLPFGDVVGGLHGVIGVLAALQARQTTGQGQDVDISMLDCQLSMWNHIATYYFLSGVQQPHLGNEHFLHMPYGVYKAKDMFIAIATVSDAQYRGVADVLDNPRLLDEQTSLDRVWRVSHRDEMNALIRAEVAKWDCLDLLAALQPIGVPCAPVNSMQQAMEDPQALSRRMVVEQTFHGRTYKMLGNPVKLSGTPCETFGLSPMLGEHTREVLRDLLGKTDVELDDYAARGVI